MLFKCSDQIMIGLLMCVNTVVVVMIAGKSTAWLLCGLSSISGTVCKPLRFVLSQSLVCIKSAFVEKGFIK